MCCFGIAHKRRTLMNSFTVYVSIFREYEELQLTNVTPKNPELHTKLVSGHHHSTKCAACIDSTVNFVCFGLLHCIFDSALPLFLVAISSLTLSLFTFIQGENAVDGFFLHSWPHLPNVTIWKVNLCDLHGIVRVQTVKRCDIGLVVVVV